MATVFPQAIGMAATWDAALIQKTAEAIATEFRAKYADSVHVDELVVVGVDPERARDRLLIKQAAC